MANREEALANGDEAKGAFKFVFLFLLFLLVVLCVCIFFCLKRCLFFKYLCL